MKFIAVLLLCVLSFWHSEWLLISSRESIVFFFEQLLPSMFFLMVVIRLFVSVVNTKSHCLDRIGNSLGMDGQALILAFSAFMLGFPGGALLINEFCRKQAIDVKAARRLIYCVSCASISFMLMTISTLFHSLSFALFLYLIQFISVIFLLSATRRNRIEMQKEQKAISFFQSFSQAISFSLHAMAAILAYLLVISSIRSLLLIYFSLFDSLVLLTLEFSSALSSLSQSTLAISAQFICASALLSFGGFSVHLQVLGSCEESKLNYGIYFGYRMIQVLISVLLAVIVCTFVSF